MERINQQEAVLHGTMDCFRCCQRRVVEVNHYIYFLGRKKQKRRHCRGRVWHGNANITEYDIK